MVEEKDPVESAIEKMKPMLSQISFGSFVGYCSGTAMKKIGKVLAFAIGVGFIGIQSAANAGFINIDWERVQESAIKPIDTTGDGKLDSEDLKNWWKKVREMLTKELPSTGGFGLGFLCGIRYG